MNYRIEEVGDFSVCGMNTEITKWQSKNMVICERFWIQFNKILKKYLRQNSNWVKFAFTYKENDKYFYFCSIPEISSIPKEFYIKKILKKKYLVFEHVGKMSLIKNTINKIYKEFIPNHKFVPDKSHFFHYERYDEKFYWNSSSSIINIYVPITEDSIKEEYDFQEKR